MRRHAFLLDHAQKNIIDEITCTVYGEMEDGTKVWETVEEQETNQGLYYLVKYGTHYYFISC